MKSIYHTVTLVAVTAISAIASAAPKTGPGTGLNRSAGTTLAPTVTPRPLPVRRAGHGKHPLPAGRRERQVPWSIAAGRPEINPGHSDGIYIWHEAGQVYLVATSESDRGIRFGGQIVVQGGEITSPQPLKLEKDDRMRQDTKNRLEFHFRTYEATDGLTFRLDDGLSIRLFLHENGRPAEHLFLGKHAIEAEGRPLVIDIGR